MGVLNRGEGEIHAKIVYFGPEGAGKTANVEFIYRKLKKAHRGELRVNHAQNDPEATYEFLPVQLGSVRDFQTSIHIHTVPDGPNCSEERRRILDGVDGIVFVADQRPDRHSATVAALSELREHLESYGRSLDDVAVVLQYNRRFESDENALDSLHRQLDLKPDASFEAVASDGTGVLNCLTSLSKLILSRLRRAANAATGSTVPAPEEPAEIESSGMSTTALQPPPALHAAATLDPAPEELQKGFALKSAGPVEADGHELRIPIRILDEASGRELSLCLRLRIDS